MKTNLSHLIPLILFSALPLRADVLSDGLEAERQGDLPGAQMDFQQALKERPNDHQARASLERVEAVLKQRDRQAESDRRRAAAEDERLHKTDQKQLEEARERRRDDGLSLLSAGNILGAWDVFQSLLRETPDFIPARKGLEKVENALDRAIRRGEFPSPRHYAAAQAASLYDAGHWEDAARLFDQAMAGGPLPEDLAAARLPAYAAEAKRRSPRAMGPVLKPLVSTDSSAAEIPMDPPADESERLYREGLRLYGLDRRQEARAQFEQALRLKPAYEEAREALDRMNEEEPHAAR